MRLGRAVSPVLLFLAATTGAAAEPDVAASLRRIVAASCGEPDRSAAAIAARLGDAVLVDQNETMIRTTRRVRLNFRRSSGDHVRLMTLGRDGVTFRLFAELHRPADGGATRPEMMAVADGACRIVYARSITYDAEGRADELVILSADLADTDRREKFNPPVPPGVDPGGVTVAVIDSGINYRLPIFAARLARDGAGRALGHDYGDMDDRPYDIDTSRSPFFPGHHGTRVASVVVREAPAIRLIPYRYPRPDMARMGDLIADADAKGATIVAVAMGSNKPEDWVAFAAAARARPHMLFVISAGNNGRDIDARPVYPAALAIDNAIVVTSGYRDGRLARGSNWGRRAVDLMVPAEDIAVVDHLGAATLASGSSYAVPRVAALAARLAARNPPWDGLALKRAIIARARPVPGDGEPIVRHGWIGDPTADP
jgi:subtilisin family serine protease